MLVADQRIMRSQERSLVCDKLNSYFKKEGEKKIIEEISSESELEANGEESETEENDEMV